MSEKTPPSPSQRPDRGDATREKLLAASIDVFGRLGFDGATTRALADAAGVNLQAIPYYFGGKEGLYIAAAEYLTTLISAHVGDFRTRVRARLAQGPSNPVDADEARALLTEILERMAGLFLSSQSEPWARFIIREQMEPTEAFSRVYGGIMQPMLGIAANLVGIILGEDPASEHVRLRTFSLLGNIMVFRVAHAAVLKHLDWTTIGPRELDAVHSLVGEVVASLQPRRTA
ncbi:CerR family C-terminal domain-containing protein [Roseiarcaceae bacterium H3SJ34-1]|uniref:CerR family C-terminal domain-containing protein n=1 Tax=Terripilifer ovatus TaxID=3032367 RepID=UPI003AB9919B|nr:CerR family C-terminal domain-containing protein [Roseiarcaceae bacterium H3SJ34-1]